MYQKLSFRKKLFIYLALIFAVFTVLVLIFQYNREKDFKQKQLEISLDDITEITNNFIKVNGLTDSDNYKLIDSVMTLIPKSNIRITVINPTGTVIYDSEVEDLSTMENHLYRTEVRGSVASKYGSTIRKSATTGKSYYYYSKFYSSYFIRTAALYDVRVIDFLRIEKMFLVYLIALFLVVCIVLFFLTDTISKTLINLKDVAIKLSAGNNDVSEIKFPNDELGVISNQIVAVYKKLNRAKEEVSNEKNKLYSHLHALEEGIAFFSSDKKKTLTNNHFIQYLNFISDTSTISAETIFEIKELEPIVRFIDKNLNSTKNNSNSLDSTVEEEYDFSKNNKFFNVKCIFFNDKSFEIVITNTSKHEKRRRVKQQMTSNISHELKTPVATVMGYLETLQNNKVDAEKQNYFIDKAYSQAKRLSDLIEDISTLNKIEEAKEQFVFEEINIYDLVSEIKENLQLGLSANKVKVDINIGRSLVLQGSKSLLFSVFYNLFDNAIKYGGENIEIIISHHNEDKEFHYFSFSNSGNEIEKQHLPNIFERFYRVDSGRSRKTGGTGLGLAIVKNAILLHNGEISAKNYAEGGVEFMFTLAK